MDSAERRLSWTALHQEVHYSSHEDQARPSDASRLQRNRLAWEKMTALSLLKQETGITRKTVAQPLQKRKWKIWRLATLLQTLVRCVGDHEEAFRSPFSSCYSRLFLYGVRVHFYGPITPSPLEKELWSYDYSPSPPRNWRP